MELRKGYKNTEVGIIPNDWEVDSIGNLAIIKTGGKNTQDRVENGEYPFFVRSQIVERINTYSYDGEAVLTAGDGVGVGKVVHYINGRFDFHQRVYRISDFSSSIDGYYFFEYFRNNFLNRIMQMTAKSSVDSVRMEMIANMLIPFPPTKAEQTAIATALSDMDNLIAGLEILIEKKKAIKQGAMQELLRPKEGWVLDSPLSNILYVQGGYAFKSGLFKDIGIPIIRISDVGDGVVSLLNCVKYDDISLPEIFCASKGDVLIAMSGATTGKIGIYTESKTAYINQRVGNFFVLDKRKNSLQFVSHLVQSHKFRVGLLKELAQGAQPNISGKQIESIVIDYPFSIEEQNEIATILSDIENEIMLMEKNLFKYHLLKNGMMQELLTGKTRLV